MLSGFVAVQIWLRLGLVVSTLVGIALWWLSLSRSTPLRYYSALVSARPLFLLAPLCYWAVPANQLADISLRAWLILWGYMGVFPAVTD